MTSLAIDNTTLDQLRSDLRQAELDADQLTAENARLRDALAPFMSAAKIIASRPGDYQDRIAMIGGLGTAADLTKTHFVRLLEAAL